jgi:hypothetical protein
MGNPNPDLYSGSRHARDTAGDRHRQHGRERLSRSEKAGSSRIYSARLRRRSVWTVSGHLSDVIIELAVGAVGVLGVVAWRAANRKHVIAHGESAQATILHVEKIELRDYPGSLELFLNIQVAIPRPDGGEIVGTARAPWSDNPPKVGWTVPVIYLERLGTTPKVQIVGPAAALDD